MPYIFIHGLGQNSSSWDKTLSLLPDSSGALCPDLAGLLGDKEFSYPNLYKAFSDYCGGVAGRLDLCGLSLGAVLALNYAAEHPEKAGSLILIGGQYKMPKALLKLQNLVFRLVPEKSFASWGLSKKDIIGLANSMSDLDFTAKLKDISCETLVICGARDAANKKAARGLAEKIPSGRLHIIENAGHEVNRDAPEALAALVSESVKRKAKSEEVRLADNI